VWYYLYITLFDFLIGREALGESFTENLGWILFSTFTIYMITFAVIHTIESLKKLRLKEKQTAELKGLSRQQEIATLKAQLNPHFLFNTLNSINATVTKDPGATRQMIAKLSEMLRYSLDSFEKEQVSIAEELHFVKTYLDLEQRRLGDRLKVDIDMDEKIKDLPVPPMILQPLVENAVKHGIASLEEGGYILIHIKQKAETVRFMVKDTGRGIPPDYQSNGIGLRNTNEMLVKRFGKEHQLNITPNEPKGTKVEFSIPIN
jgi:LytS/YehU family sensor histidine kinase